MGSSTAKVRTQLECARGCFCTYNAVFVVVVVAVVAVVVVVAVTIAIAAVVDVVATTRHRIRSTVECVVDSQTRSGFAHVGH